MPEKHISFTGGLQLTGTPLGRDPGSMLACHNYEIGLNGGYQRVDGYTSLGMVPGSGPVRGLEMFAGELYAWRDNADASACVMYHYVPGSGWNVVTTPTLLPGGKYEFYIYNFKGSAQDTRLYGVDGVNPGFSFDGATFSQISTGMPEEKPTHLICFKKHLFFSFRGGSVQNSSIGDPTTWSAVTGSEEIGAGDEIQGFSEEVGGNLFVYSRNRTDVISGSSSADWVMQPYSADSGAIAGTIRSIGRSTFLDDRGMMQLEAAQIYGGFKAATFSRNVEPLLTPLMHEHSVNCAQVVREKGQYRLYFSDGTVLVSTFVGSKLAGITRAVFPHTMVACTTREDSDGIERVFYADADGNVYQEGGDSFAGEKIIHFFRLQYHHFGSPTRRKQFRRAFFETLATGAISLAVAPTYDYGSAASPRALTASLNNDFSGVQGYWTSSRYGEFNWSVPFSPSQPVRISGLGGNMSLLISGQSDNVSRHTLYGVIISFDYRGAIR